MNQRVTVKPKTSLTGEPLTVRSLSSALTSTASYQMTICAIKHADYLLRRIRDEPDPVHVQATALRAEMRKIGLRMIRQLDWRDFETFSRFDFLAGRLAAFTTGTGAQQWASLPRSLTQKNLSLDIDTKGGNAS